MKGQHFFLEQINVRIPDLPAQEVSYFFLACVNEYYWYLFKNVLIRLNIVITQPPHTSSQSSGYSANKPVSLSANKCVNFHSSSNIKGLRSMVKNEITPIVFILNILLVYRREDICFNRISGSNFSECFFSFVLSEEQVASDKTKLHTRPKFAVRASMHNFQAPFYFHSVWKIYKIVPH